QTLTHAGELRRVADAAEVAVLECAAHWADLHGVVEHAGPSLPGMQQLTLLGGVGTPKVAEFAPAELGAELGVTTYAARLLVADALDLRHRLPRLWARVQAGQVKPWVGRRVAQQTRDRDSEIAATVDAAVAPWADRLTWTRLETLVDATIIEVDPDRAQREAEERRGQQGVWVNRNADHETGTCFIRADAVDLTFFDAAVDRIADGIALLGDLAGKDLRRARAIGILANPQQTLDLYQAAATAARSLDPAEIPADVTSSAGLAEADSSGADDPGETDKAPATPPPARLVVDPRPPAILYIHISQESLLRDTAGWPESRTSARTPSTKPNGGFGTATWS
ncbi:MAG: 13E12 repeat family protein, partial [Actinomycetota bacterium]|nr:13E12 repeat family protein [Actinomycetota bacterium]